MSASHPDKIGAEAEPATTAVVSPDGVRAGSAEELRERSEARKGGLPILVYREPGGQQHLVVLDVDEGRLTIGRRPDNAVPLTWTPTPRGSMPSSSAWAGSGSSSTTACRATARSSTADG